MFENNMLHGVCYVEHLDCTFYIKYNIEKCYSASRVVSYYITTDTGYDYSFNAFEGDSDSAVIELAEELIKDGWYDENI